MSDAVQLSSSEVEALLVKLHDTVSQLKHFVLDQELHNREQEAAGSGQQEVGAGRGRSPRTTPQPGKADEDKGFTDDLFDGMLQYIRGSVTNAMKGGTRSSPGKLLKAAQQGKSSRHRESEASQLRALLRATISELENERAEKHHLMNELRRFNGLMEEFRKENNVLQVYKDRIVELQAVVNGTKKPGEVGSELGSPEPLMPSGVKLTIEQQRLEVPNELARLAVLAKDKADRHMAEKLKLQSDNMVLIGLNSILTDRVRVLEAQLSVLTASSSVALRELNKQRLQAAMAVEAPHHVQRKLGPTEVRIGGTVMEAEVAIWLRDMYLKLLHDPEASQHLLNVKSVETKPSLAIAGAVAGPSPSANVGGGNQRSASAASQRSAPARVATPAASSIAGRPTSQASTRSSQRGGARASPAPKTRDGKSFTEYAELLEEAANALTPPA